MQTFEGEKEFTFLLSYLEAAYLNAAVVDFFHKMRAAAGSTGLMLIADNDYQIAKSLWDKIEKEIPVGDWK